MKFNLEKMQWLIEMAQPSFVNIGADSKNNRLPEPTKGEIDALIQKLGRLVRKKENLDRIITSTDK